jgi:hypothetical protein
MNKELLGKINHEITSIEPVEYRGGRFGRRQRDELARDNIRDGHALLRGEYPDGEECDEGVGYLRRQIARRKGMVERYDAEWRAEDDRAEKVRVETLSLEEEQYREGLRQQQELKIRDRRQRALKRLPGGYPART